MFCLNVCRSLEGGRPRPPCSRMSQTRTWRTRRSASLQRELPRGVLYFCFAVLLFAAMATVAQAEGTPPLAPALLSTNAASAASAPGQPVALSGITLRQAWATGGWIMWVLAAMALTGVVLLIRQLPVLRDNYIAPRGLLLEVLERIRAGELNEARRLCEDRPCPLSAIALKTFDHLRHAPKAGVILLRDSVEAEGARQADVMLAQVTKCLTNRHSPRQLRNESKNVISAGPRLAICSGVIFDLPVVGRSHRQRHPETWALRAM